MARRTVDDLIADLEKLLRVWQSKANFSIADITKESLQATIAGLRAKSSELEDGKTTVARLVNELNELIGGGQQTQTRGLSGVRAAFGPDSSEYEQAGGTRASERKKPTPKKKT